MLSLEKEKILLRFLQKKLIKGKKKLTGGRNNQGIVTMKHLGGQYKRRLRILNFSFFFWGCYGIILKFLYDPNRNAPVMLVCYLNGILSYHLAVKNLKIGDLCFIGLNNVIKKFVNGSCSKFMDLTEGLLISNIEYFLNKGAVFARSAGTSAQLLKIDKLKKTVLIRLPSKEERLISIYGICVLGQIANYNHFLLFLDKAGRVRHLGRRSKVRGVAMNPVDHPHGGGQGKTSGAGGFRSQVTFKSKVAKTQATRKRKKNNKFILKIRKK